MTAPLIAPLDLEDIGFSIRCEYHCEQPAVVMCKGCADHAHAALCAHHLGVVRQRFDDHAGRVVCENCHRPWLAFETHYDVQGL